jgi:hypothetical protein
MPDLSAQVQVSSARVWFCRFRSVAPIVALENLRTLEVAGFPDDTLAPLRALRKLRYLKIVHLPRVAELSPLAELAGLEVLSLATLPGWDASGKVTVVDSLRPIAALSNLRHLELFGVVPTSRSLEDLCTCQELRTARFSKYPADEVANFYRTTGVTNEYAPKPMAG